MPRTGTHSRLICTFYTVDREFGRKPQHCMGPTPDLCWFDGYSKYPRGHSTGVVPVIPQTPNLREGSQDRVSTPQTVLISTLFTFLAEVLRHNSLPTLTLLLAGPPTQCTSLHPPTTPATQPLLERSRTEYMGHPS